MPPRRKTAKPHPYGRQAEGRTQKSISLDLKIAMWAESQAKAQGKDFSAYIAELLSEAQKARTTLIEGSTLAEDPPPNP